MNKMNFKLKIFGIILLCSLLSCVDKQSNESTDSNVKNLTEIAQHSKSDGSAMDYLSCGEGDTTLLFVHGWGINNTYWSDQMKAFCPRYRVIAVELPGFHDGDTTRTNWSVPDLSSDVQSLLDQLELNNVVLIGHSMGGSVILETAIHRANKVIGFIGIDNFQDVGVERDQDTEAGIAEFFKMLENDFASTSTYYANSFLFHERTDTLIKQRVIDDIVSSHPKNSMLMLKYLFEYEPKELTNFQQLNRKVFLLNSDAIPTDVSKLKEAGVEVEVLSVGLTGHYPMIENPMKFNQTLKQALAKI